MTIKARLLTAVLASVLAAALSGLVGLWALNSFKGHVSDAMEDSQRVFLTQQLNALVTTVVMEARSVQTMPDARAAEPGAGVIERALKEMEGLFQPWEPLIDPEQRAAFVALRVATGDFIAFFKENARLATSLAPLAALDHGRQEAKFTTAVRQVLAQMSDYDRGEFQKALRRGGEVYETAVMQVLAIAAAAVALGAGFAGYVCVAHVSRPLRRVTHALEGVAAGRNQIDIPSKLGRDEIGALWRAVADFREARLAQERLREEQAAAKLRAAEDQRLALLSMAETFEASVGAVIETVSDTSDRLLAESEVMRGMSQTVAQTSQSAAAASDQTRTNVQSVAGAAEQMSASVSEINRRMAHAANLISAAAARLTASDADVAALTQSADRIGNMASIIRDIAAQTNLLALNATIEAARAGESGRGFAVVASEVKVLAEQTSRATQDIEQQISSIQQASTRTVAAIGEFARKIHELSEVGQMVSASTEEQDAASRAIAENVQEVAVGTGSTARAVAELSAVAGRSGEAASRVLDVAGALSQQSQRLKEEVETVLSRIRA